MTPKKVYVVNDKHQKRVLLGFYNNWIFNPIEDGYVVKIEDFFTVLKHQKSVCGERKCGCCNHYEDENGKYVYLTWEQSPTLF